LLQKEIAPSRNGKLHSANSSVSIVAFGKSILFETHKSQSRKHFSVAGIAARKIHEFRKLLELRIDISQDAALKLVCGRMWV